MCKIIFTEYSLYAFTRRTHRKIAILTGLLYFLLPYVYSQPPLRVQELARFTPDQRIEQLLNIVFRTGIVYLRPSYLDSLQTTAATLGDNRLAHYVHVVGLQHQQLNKADLKQDAALTAYVEQSPYTDLKGYLFYMKGMAAFYANQYSKALPDLFRAKAIFDQAYPDPSALPQFYLKGFFEVYYYYEDYNTAAYYSRLALKHGHSDIFARSGVWNNLGLSYLKMRRFDKAKTAFEAGVRACRQEKRQDYEALITGNLGNVLRLQGNYREALPFLYQDIRTNEKVIPENAVISRFYAANALLHLDSVSKAKTYLAPPAVVMPVWTHPGYDLIRYETLGLYHHKTGDFRKAAAYKDSLLALKDSLKQEFDYKKITVLESTLQAEKYLAGQKKVQRAVLRRNLIIGALIVIFTGLLFWLNKRRHQTIRQQAIRQRQTEEQLANATKQLEEYVRFLNERNALIEDITLRLKSATGQQPDSAEPAQEPAAIRSLHESILLTEDHWKEFKTRFDKVFPEFFTKLRSRYPDLTPAETRLLALQHLQLPSRNIANMLAISPESLKKTRYRLRKKYPQLLADANDTTMP